MSSLRRSARLQPNTESTPSGILPSNTRKRRKTEFAEGANSQRSKRRPSRGNADTPSDLVQLPLDVLYEVFLYLSAVDLLYLARTSKALRNVMLNRSSRAIWLNALVNPNIPDLAAPPACPADLAEPAYASLIYEHVRKANYPLDAAHGRPEADLRELLRVETKNSFVNTNMLLTSLGHKYAGIVEEYLPPIDPPAQSELIKAHKGTHYFAEDAKRVVTFIKANFSRKDKMAAFAAERSIILQEHERRIEDAVQYEAWVARATVALQVWRRAMDDDARGARRDAILTRASAAGYDDVVALIRTPGTHFPTLHQRMRFIDRDDFVDSPKPLTDQEWEKEKRSVLTTMEMFLLLVPIQRRLRLLQDAYKAHPATTNASWDRESNELAELYLQADIVDVICAPLPLRLDEPDPNLTDVDFRPGIDKYLADADMRAEVRRYVLNNMLPAGVDLDSATAFFECELCKKVLHTPAALAHQCYRYHLPADNSPPLNLLLDDYGFRLPWYYKKSLVYAADAAEIGAQLVQMSGRDPSSTTLGDMDPVRYRCNLPPCKRRWPLGIPYADCTITHCLHHNHDLEDLVVISGLVVAPPSES